MSLKDTYLSFQKELEEKIVLRIAVFALGILFAWLIYIEIADYHEEIFDEYTEKYENYEGLERLQRETFWQLREKQSLNVLTHLKGRLWPLENDGLARANFQSFLTNLAQKSGIKKPVVNVEKVKFDKNFPGYKRLLAVLTGFAEPEAIEKFLGAVLKQDRLVIIQDLEFSSPPPRSIRASVVVYMPETRKK